jgi:hypothetical protein
MFQTLFARGIRCSNQIKTILNVKVGVEESIVNHSSVCRVKTQTRQKVRLESLIHGAFAMDSSTTTYDYI